MFLMINLYINKLFFYLFIYLLALQEVNSFFFILHILHIMSVSMSDNMCVCVYVCTHKWILNLQWFASGAKWNERKNKTCLLIRNC